MIIMFIRVRKPEAGSRKPEVGRRIQRERRVCIQYKESDDSIQRENKVSQKLEIKESIFGLPTSDFGQIENRFYSITKKVTIN